MPRKIIIDTDPGQDDAVAILLALASPEMDVRAVIAVAGNVPLALTSVNARRVLEMAGRTDVPFYEGASRPLGGAPVTAEHVHGRTGLDGVAFDAPPSMPVPGRSGVTYLIETLHAAAEEEYVFVALGPLTDLAIALSLAPDIARGLERIVLMGGAWSELGNITPSAEFNIYADPIAARIVFDSLVPITVLPLDVTHQCRTMPERLAAFRANGNRCSLAAADLLSFPQGFDLRKYGWEGAPLHDRLASAPGALRRQDGQRRHRDGQRAEPGHDRRGLVGGDGARPQRLVPARRGPCRLLRPADGTSRSAALNGLPLVARLRSRFRAGIRSLRRTARA